MTVFQEITAGTIPARLSVDQLYELTAAGVFAENENIELIDGEIVPMAAAKADWHEIMKFRLTRVLARTLGEEARLFIEPSVTFAPAVLLEPDLAVWPKGGMPRQVRGPDLLLVIEVADSSIGYDLKVKAPLYARYGVRDYWVVDAVRQTVRIHREPGEPGYRNVTEFTSDQRVEPLLLPGVGFRLAELD